MEEKHLALTAFGPAAATDTATFLSFKARLQGLFDAVRVEVMWTEMATSELPALHPGRLAHLTTKQGQHLGYVGEINPELTRRLGGGSKAYFAELSASALSHMTEEEIVYREFSRFPLAHRDISLIGPKTASYADLETVLQSAGAPLLVAYELFDVFETETEKSFALHLSFGSSERTLASDEMDKAFESIVVAAEERLKFRLKM